MKRIVATFLLLLTAVPLFGQAKWGGVARQIAMGGANSGTGLVLNPYVWEDPAYLLLNPAYQTMYKDYVWMNIGGGTLTGLTTANNGYGQQNAGINFALDKEWSLGAIFSHDPSAANNVRGLIAGTGGLGFPGGSFSIMQRAPQTIPAIANVWEVLGSYDGSMIDLGFGFTYGNSNAENNNSSTFATTTSTTNTEASARMIGFRAGGILDLGGGNAVDFSLAFRTDKATDKISSTPAPTGPTDGEYSASGTEFQVTGRLKWKLSNRVNINPFVAFGTLSGEPKEDAKPTTIATATNRSLKASATLLSIGIGPEYKTTDVYVAAGVNFTTTKAKVEYSRPAVGAIPDSSITLTSTYTALPVFNIGAEWWFADWLAGRAGYYRAIGSNTTKTEGKTGNLSLSFESKTSAPTSALLIGGLNGGNYDGIVTLGIGFRFGNFSLDATVSEEALRRGFGLVGSNDNLNSFGYMNASFSFE